MSEVSCKDLCIKATGMAVEKDVETGRLHITFDGEEGGVTLVVPAYRALGVGVEILAKAKEVIDEFYDRVAEGKGAKA